MKYIKKFLLIILFLSGTLTVMLFNSCDPPIEEDPAGKLKLTFEHTFDGLPIEFDNMKYTNAAGNNIEFSEIQWFLSDVTLHKKDGSTVLLDSWTFYHYVDTDIPSTLEWELEDKIDIGEYESLSFVFGFTGERNEPYMFVNFPESAMFWPLHLGGDQGGYHYLKLNGFWMTNTNFRRGFQFHLGVGQEQDANGNRITDNDGNYIFVQNWFEVDLDNSAVTIKDSETSELTIRMNVEEWLKNPNDYDFNVFGGETMENQKALNTIKENGSTVFSVVK